MLFTPRKSVKGTSTLSKNPRLLGYWELIREAVYQPFLFSFWNDSHHKPHTFTPWGGESLCVACLSRPIRPTPFSLYIHIFIYILKLKPGGIKESDSTVQHQWAQTMNRPQVNYSNQQESCLACKHAQGFPRDRAGASFSALLLQLRHANCFERVKNGCLLTCVRCCESHEEYKFFFLFI